MVRAVLFSFLVATITSPLGAQTAATGALVGVVQDVNGSPLADVSVTLLGESASVRTDSAGRFALRDVAVGGHTALFRRIGYRSVEYRWTAQGDRVLQISVTMSPAPRQLERVVVEAPGASRRRGTSSIGGTVTDSAGRPIADADVRLLGAGLTTATDSSGRFEFQLLASGAYIVRARRAGLAPSTYVIQIADDDNRGVSLKMFGLAKRTTARDVQSASGYGIPDQGFDAFDRRARGGRGYPIFGPGDLFRADRASLDFMLQQYRDLAGQTRRKAPNQGVGSTEDGDCLLIDGRRAVYQPLRTFTSVQAQLVEVSRANAFVDDFTTSQMESIRECRGTMDRHPTYYAVWTRALR
jgi:hypothetical protein